MPSTSTRIKNMSKIKLASLQHHASNDALSEEYTICVNAVKRILNNSKIERHSLLINITNVGETLTYKQQAMLIRFVNFTAKGDKIICYNGSLIYTPDYLIKQHNTSFLEEINTYLAAHTNTQKVTSMLSWFFKPM